MAELAQSGREIKDFPGLVLDSDLHDLQDGSTNLQVNCTSEDHGVLRSRHGYALCLFEGELPFTEPVNYKPVQPVEEDVAPAPFTPFFEWYPPVLYNAEPEGPNSNIDPSIRYDPSLLQFPPIVPNTRPWWG